MNNSMIISMPRILIVISLFALGINAQTPTPSPSMKTILEGKIKESFGQCGGWPPRLVKQDKRLDKKVPDGAPDVSNELINLIIKESDFTDLSESPTLYKASHLRLLDSIGFDSTNANGLISDTELFGLAGSASREEIQAWGTSHALVKLDCMSMLNLAANAKPGFVIPLINLESAFSASRQADRRDQIVIYYAAQLNSPFDRALDSSDPARKRFALMRALSWRLKHAANANAKYVSKGTFLVLDNHSNSNQNSSILGNIKAGLNIPFVNLNGAADGKLAKTMTSEVSSYSTYYWKTSLVDLPSTTELVTSLDGTMNTPFKFDRNEIKTQQTIIATAEIEGWDPRLCILRWKGDAANTNFKVIDVAVQVKPTPASTETISNPFVVPATCIVTAKFFLNSNPPNNELIGSPRLSMKLVDTAAVSFSLNTPDRLFLIGKPTVNMALMNATWEKKTVGSTDFVKWNLVGRVDPPKPQAGEQRKIVSVQTRNDNLVCDNGKEIVPLNALNQISPSNDPKFQAEALLLVDSAGGKYDSNPNQPDTIKRRCTIKGELIVTTSLPNGTAPEDETVGFSTINEIDFPSKVSAPAVPTGLTVKIVDGKVRLSWEKPYSAESYLIYRSTSVDEEGESIGGNELKAASFDDQLPAAATVTPVTYYYRIKATNSKGTSKAASFEPVKWVKSTQ